MFLWRWQAFIPFSVIPEPDHCVSLCGYQLAAKIILFGSCAGLGWIRSCAGEQIAPSTGQRKVSSLNLAYLFLLYKEEVLKGRGWKCFAIHLFCIPISICEALKVSSSCFVSTILHQIKGRKWEGRACAGGGTKSVASLLNLTVTRRPNGDSRRRLRIKKFFN